MPSPCHRGRARLVVLLRQRPQTPPTSPTSSSPQLVTSPLPTSPPAPALAPVSLHPLLPESTATARQWLAHYNNRNPVPSNDPDVARFRNSITWIISALQRIATSAVGTPTTATRLHNSFKQLIAEVPLNRLLSIVHGAIPDRPAQILGSTSFRICHLAGLEEVPHDMTK